MPIKVVLTVMPYFNHIYSFPLQLAYLKAYLIQDSDIDVKIFDAESFYFYSDVIKGDANFYWQKIYGADCAIDEKTKPILDMMVDSLLSSDPDVVGFSVSHPNYIFTRYVSQEIKRKKPGVYIVYGGLCYCFQERRISHVAQLHQSLHDVDCIIKNEGESALLELVQVLKKGKSPNFIPGVTLRKKNRITDCGSRPLIGDIDLVPFPVFDDYSKEKYLADYIRILFFRGCSGRCSFCRENYVMGSVRMRSASNIVSEISLRISQGYKRFQSCDLSLNPSVPRLEEILKLIIKETPGIEFVFGQFRHSGGFTRETFSLLKKAGFRNAYFGTESFSQTVLNSMRKDTDTAIIIKNIKDAYAEGLKVVLFFIVGFPAETEKTFEETINFIKTNAHCISAVQHISPLHINFGAPIYDALSDYGVDPYSVSESPNLWKTYDGKNNYQWRLGLYKRMCDCLIDSGIPMVDFLKEGNPSVPFSKKSLQA